jgi:HEAT repeat protein
MINLCPQPKQPNPYDVDKLVAILRKRTNSSKRRGLAAIGLGFSDTPDARDALVEVMTNEKSDDFVAWCAVEALTQSSHPEVFDCAASLVRTKEHGRKQLSFVRVRAVYLLGWVGKNAEAENLLREALRDRNCFVRGYAVEATARLDMVGARKEIERILQEDTEPFVLRKAAEALGKIGTLESIPILEQHLYKGQAGNRWAVRQAVAEIQIRYGI